MFGQVLGRQSIVSTSRSGSEIHVEVDGGQRGQGFVLLHYTHKLQKSPYLIFATIGRNVRHQCGGGLAVPTMSVAQSGILFKGVNHLMYV